MKAALGTKDQWAWKQEEWTEEWDWLLEKYRNTWAVHLFIPWGSNACFLMVSELPTSEEGNAWAEGRRLVSVLWTGLNQLTGWAVSRELSISIVVAASAMGSPCHFLLWHSGFRWQQRKKFALGPGRISKWSWPPPFLLRFEDTVFGVRRGKSHRQKTKQKIVIRCARTE